MDSTVLLISVIVFVLVIAIVFSMVKGVIKIVFSIMSVLTLIGIVLGAFVLFDAINFKNNYGSEDKKAIVVDGTDVLTGMTISGIIDARPTPLTDEELAEYSIHYKENNLGQIQGKSYKLIIFDIDSLRELDIKDTTIGSQDFSKELILTIIESDDPKEVFRQNMQGSTSMEGYELKSTMFTIMFNKIMASPVYMLSQQKKGNIIFYPETAVFKALKYIPLGVIKDSVGNTVTKAKSIVS